MEVDKAEKLENSQLNILSKQDVQQYPECLQQLLCDLSVVVGSVSSCVLLEGPSGSGKTTLVSTLAELQQQELMVVYLGEQIDSKVLLGTFASASSPGEFVWRPGPLTKAVDMGVWLLLEDIDLAAPDVLGLLLPLVKTRELMIPGYTRPLRAAQSFKLFLSQRTYTDGSPFLSPSFSLLQLLSQHAVIFQMPSLSRKSTSQILTLKHPDLKKLIDKLVELSEETNLHIRQLLKFCERVAPQVYNGRITSVEDVLLEVIDCLCGPLVYKERENFISQFSSLVGGVSKEKIEQLCRSHRPPVQISPTAVSVGRAHLTRIKTENSEMCFAHTSAALRLLESVCRCVQMNEPVLLVGETGVGKTAVVNYLSKVTGNQLVVYNMSEQTESTDLLGGFKPLQFRHLLTPVKEKFEKLFHATFSLKQNGPFLSNLQETFAKQKWRKLLKLMMHSVESALNAGTGTQISEWKRLAETIAKFQKQLTKSRSTLIFDFVEGALVEAVRTGSWILLDEVNLASSETLQCLSGLLESPNSSFLLPEKIDAGPVNRHPNFRLFCCMNPATDFGKKSLPYSIRNRLTEFSVEEISDPSDLRLLVHTYLQCASPPSKLVEGIIKLHLDMKKLAESRLQDGTGRKPHYSLRNLCRALSYCRQLHCGSLLRSAYEGFCMSFLSEVRSDYHSLITGLITQHLSIPGSCISAPIAPPTSSKYVQVEGFWLHKGAMEPSVAEEYVLTKSVRRNVRNLARVISARTLPVLLQGPTSAGKTSMVQYLARMLGHQCVRINNHEHTDLQEYVGMYTASPQGQLVFQEGVLVDAMRNGYWIILDELNLAPTEVLEALNRVLDDNRELFIPETQELIKAHPNFLLFGTQNPPGIYAGRKVLSRAFRNRFIELHIDDIPPDELVTILHQRCSLPTSYAKKMVAVMKELQLVRSEAGIFHGRHGLITLRDLFRWAERYRKSNTLNKFYDWEQQLAEDGYMLLGGRLRATDQQNTILEVVQKHFKKSVNLDKLFGLDGGSGSLASKASLSILHQTMPEGFQHLVWTDELQTMAVLVHRALSFDEPVLMVGATGCGKTSLCQLLSALIGRQLFSISCHLHTDAADFLGGLRPLRNRHSKEDDSNNSALFEWSDGVVIHAMRAGGCLMIDEISLAGDAVLERLNSILEPERKLLVSERTRLKGEVYEITASPGFAVLATMNPGGDYGKKELSPALRNRFVEIWCSAANSRKSYLKIIEHNLNPCFLSTGTDVPWSKLICDVVEQLRDSSRLPVSVRDLLTWVSFMNTTSAYLTPAQGFLHGAHLVFIDALGCGSSLGAVTLREEILRHLTSLLQQWAGSLDEENGAAVTSTDTVFGIPPFYIDKGPVVPSTLTDYSLTAPGPTENLFRLLRAMQLGKPLLLEGPPGVGKTSLVTSLAAASGNRVIRVNLSEQTDISDLFGADLPVEGGEKVQFAWRDGPFLKALRRGDWIILDEMNLASQSVLEGLNACLDHRGEVFIPELGMTFKVKSSNRLFACQNPLQQGGGRKGLPKSFINRFTQVYMDKLNPEDLLHICSQVFPQFDRETLEKMIKFTFQVDALVKSESVYKIWEFNLRDILRWCSLMQKHKTQDPSLHVHMLFCSRMREKELKEKIYQLYVDVFEVVEGSEYKLPAALGQYFHVSKDTVQVGTVVLTKHGYQLVDEDCERIAPLCCQMGVMEVLAHCVEMGWMSIIVGKSSMGKSSVVRSLARLCGHKLLELPVTSITDTTDLLGGYEQVNFRRHCINLADLVLDTAVCVLSCANNDPSKFQQSSVDHLKSIVKELQQEYCPAVCEGARDKQVLLSKCKRLKSLVKAILMMTKSSDFVLPHDLGAVVCDIESLYKRVTVSESTGQFEWVNSALVEAVHHGHWLLIPHANFCSPSVLDRLNALLEPGGVLSLDERGIIGDSQLVIRPHPNFRLFLTMDPCHGELSRALRNRGIEVYLHSEESLLNTGKFEDDLRTLLHLNASLNPSSPLFNIAHSDLTPQKLVTLMKYTTLLSKRNVDGCVALTEAQRILGIDNTEPTSEMKAVATCVQNSFSSAEFYVSPVHCISKRDFAPIAKMDISDLRESNKAAILTAALEVFVCSCSLGEVSYRLELLESFAAGLINTHYKSIVLAWIRVLTKMVSSPTLHQGVGVCQLYPTSNPLSSLMPSSQLNLPVTMLPISAELSVLRTTIEGHLSQAAVTQRPSPLNLSSRVYSGAVPKECLPHPSLMYLQQLLEQILTFSSDVLLSNDVTITIDESVKIQDFIDWLTVFCSVCTNPLSLLPEIVCSWNLFKSEGLSLVLSYLQSHRNWETLSTYLLGIKPLEDSVIGAKLYSISRCHLLGDDQTTVCGFPLASSTCHQDDEIRASSTPQEPFALLPTSIAMLRLNNLHASNEVQQDRQNSVVPTNDGISPGQLAAIRPLLVMVKSFLSQLLQKAFISSEDMSSCLKYCLRLYSVPLESLSPCLYLSTSDNPVQNGGIVFSLVRNWLSGFTLSSSLTKGVLLERSFFTEMCLNIHTGNHGNKLAIPQYSVSLKNLQSAREETQTLIQFSWVHESTEVFCPVANLKSSTSLVESLFRVLVYSIRTTTHYITTGEQVPVPIEAITKEIIMEICGEAVSVFDGHIKDFKAVEGCLLQVLYLLSKLDCNLEQGYWDIVTQELELLKNLHLAMAYLGIAYSIVLVPSAIDPVALQVAENQCHHSVMNKSSYLLDAWYQHYRNMVGPTFEGLPNQTAVPPVLIQLSAKLKTQSEKAGKCPSAQTRNNKKYEELHRVASDIQQTICSPLQLLEILTHLTEGVTSSTAVHVDSWLKAMQGAIDKLLREFSELADVVEPFSMALTLIVVGVGSLSVVRQHCQTPLAHQLETVQGVLQYPIKVEFESHLSWLQELTSLLTSCDSSEIELVVQQRLLKVVLSGFVDYLKNSKRRHSELRNSVHCLLNELWSVWKRAKASLQLETIEAESLYRWRTREHIIEQTSDNVTDEMLDTVFPSFDSYFTDQTEVEDQQTDTRDSKSEQHLKLESEDSNTVCALHMLLHNKEPFSVSKQPQNTALELYQLCSLWHSKLTFIPGLRADYLLHAAHVRMCDSRSSSFTKTDNSDFNVYKEGGGVAAAEKVLPIIEAVVKRVQQLLQEWPENPILSQILSVCERVLVIGVEEPLMKLLTGCERILSKAQEWEAYASSQVSLKEELNNLVQIILEWRRIELSFYEKLLESHGREVEARSSRWWFHLYGLCQEISDDLDEFTTTVQSFIETSSLGEFHSRLKLITIFQTATSANGNFAISDVLGNVHCYYSQFSARVTVAMETLTAKVVKDFKDQLKVMRWNDGSYWSLKSSVRNSHKKLLNLLKKYQEVLNEPVLPILTELSLPADEGRLKDSQPSHSSSLLALVENVVHLKELPLVDVTEYVLFEDRDLTIHSQSAHKTMRDVTNRFFVNSSCLECVEGLDQFAGEIVVTVEDLSSEAYLANVEDEKREAAIKSRQFLKQKMLSDLFKALSTQGLSFKRGLDSSSDCSVKRMFQLPIEDLPEIVSMGSLWPRMNEYYERCVARLMAVQSAFANPSKELTLPQVLRCKGYTYELLITILTQRKEFMAALRNFKELKCTLPLIHSVCTGKMDVSFSECKEWTRCLCDVLEQCLYVIQCVECLSSTVPAELDHTLTPIPPHIDQHQRTNLFASLKLLEGDVQNTYIDIVKQESYLSSCDLDIVSKRDIDVLRNGFNCVKNFSDHLADVQAKDSSIARSPIFFFIQTYEKHICSKWTQFTEWLSTIDQELHSKQSTPNQPVFRSILLAFQKLAPSVQQTTEVPTINEAVSKSLADMRSLNISQVTGEAREFLQACSSDTEKVEALQHTLCYYQQLCEVCFTQSVAVQASVCKLSSILFNVFASLGSKGFCRPAEEIDSSDTNATDFVDIEAGGFADGAGDKNVSSQAEQDNLEPGQMEGRPQDDQSGDTHQEEDAINVSEDIADEEPANVTERERETDSGDESDDDEELDNTVGKLGPEDTPGDLDKDMWAPQSDQSEEEEASQSDVKGGTEKDEETAIVAKEDSTNKTAPDQHNDPSSEPEDANSPPQENDNQSEEMQDMDLEDIAVEDDMGLDREEVPSDNEGSGEEVKEGDGSADEMMESDVENQIEDETTQAEDFIEDPQAVPTSSTLSTPGQTADDATMPETNAEESKLLAQMFSGGTSSTSNDVHEVSAMESSNQSGPEARQRRAPTNQDRSMDKDLESSAKRAKLANENEATADLSNPEDAALYRHVTETELSTADQTVWDWSNTHGRQSAYPETDKEMEEEATEEPPVETKDTMETISVSISGIAELNADKSESLKSSDDQLSSVLNKTGPLISANIFSRLDKYTLLQGTNISDIRKDIMLAVGLLQSDDSVSLQGCVSLWRQYTALTQSLAQALYEELSMILTPTSASQLRGDYRSGKRLNMRRIIPFIASSYQNDRIWLRRTKLVDRRYQVMVAMDDSLSMQENNCRQMAFESLAVITSAVTRLTNGQIGVCRFGLESEILHSMDQPFTDTEGGKLLHHLTFSQRGTSFKEMLGAMRSVFLQYAHQSTTSAPQSTVYSHLLIILSDGRGVFSDGGSVVDVGIRQLTEVGVFTVFIILDTQAKDSITDIKVPLFSPGKGPTITSYLEVFPFPFYIILRDLNKMPHVLSEALRQWFELLTK